MAIYSANYSRRLTRRLTLSDGTMLVTLRDAADLLTGKRFVGVTKWGALEHAIKLVLEAGEHGGGIGSGPPPIRSRSCCASAKCCDGSGGRLTRTRAPTR